MPICTTNMFTLSIDPRECIGASLPKINKNFENLSRAVCELSSVSIIPYDSDTIDISYDPTTRILSADVRENGHLTDAMLSAMPPFTVKGNPQTFASTPTNIPAGECSVLGRHSGITTQLAFNKLVNCQIELRTITNDKLELKTIQNDVIGDDQIDNRTLSAMPPYSVKGNATSNPNADPQDIEADAYTALVRPNHIDNLVWTPAGADSALIRTATNSLSFVNAPEDSVLMRDQTDLRFVTAPGYTAYIRENGTVPLGFSVANSDTTLFRSDVTDNLSFKPAATDTVFLRDNTHLQFAPVPENSVLARDEQHVRAISAAPFSAFIRPGVSNSPDDRMQWRVAQPDSALIRTDTLNLSFAVAPTNSVLLRDNDHLRHVPANDDTALVRTDIGTATQSLSFIPADQRTVLVRKHNEHVRFDKIDYDMFDKKIGTVAEGTIVMWYSTVASRPVSFYFDTTGPTAGLGIADKEYDGWAICNGNGYSITVDGVTETFTTPDLRSKFIVAAEFNGPGVGWRTNLVAGQLTTYPMGAEGGWEKHHLSIPELPEHVHNISSVDKGHTHGYKHAKKRRMDATWDNEDGKSGDENIQTDSSTTGIKDTAPTGQDKAHENRPPYYALYFIIKLVSGRRNKEWSLAGTLPPPPTLTPMPTPTPTPTPMPPPPGFTRIWSGTTVIFPSPVTSSQMGTSTPTSIYAPGNFQTITSGPTETLYASNAAVFAVATKLDITGLGATGDVFLENMSVLQEVELHSRVSTLSLVGSSSIKTLKVGYNKLTTFDVTPCATNLVTLDCSFNNLTSIVGLNSCTVLEDFNCSDNTTLTTINIPTTNTIKQINISNTGITTLNVSGKTNLTEFAGSGLSNVNLDLTGCNKLEQLDLGGTTFSAANGGGPNWDPATFTKLKVININGTGATGALPPLKIVDLLSKLTVTNGALNFGTGSLPSGLTGTAGYAAAKANAVAKNWNTNPALP